MGYREMGAVMECRAIKDRTHFAALLAIAYHVRGDGGLCTAAKGTLSAEARLKSKRSLDDAVKVLADPAGPAGYGVAVVEVVSPGGGRGNPPVYRLNLPWLRAHAGSEPGPEPGSERVQPLHPNPPMEPGENGATVAPFPPLNGAAVAPFESEKGATGASNDAGPAPFDGERVQPIPLKGAAAAPEPVREPVEEEEGGVPHAHDAADGPVTGYPASVERYADQIAERAALGEGDRERWAFRALNVRGGGALPAARRDLADRLTRAGPAAVTAALVVTENDATAHRYGSRLAFLDTVLDTISDHARRAHLPPADPDPASGGVPARRPKRAPARAGAWGPTDFDA